MNMLGKLSLLTAVTALSVSTVYSQFLGPAFFSVAPWSQVGAVVTNNLTITNLPNGFDVSGDIWIQVHAGTWSGLLIQWYVDRPLDPAWAPTAVPMFTTTHLDGYSQPPAFGTYSNTTGIAETFFTNYQGVSNSQIPLSLTAGSATWSNITVTGPTFLYTSGGTHYLRQRFELDAGQLAGPGGLWRIDVPLTSTMTPEPSSVALLVPGLGLALAALRRRKA